MKTHIERFLQHFPPRDLSRVIYEELAAAMSSAAGFPWLRQAGDKCSTSCERGTRVSRACGCRGRGDARAPPPLCLPTSCSGARTHELHTGKQRWGSFHHTFLQEKPLISIRFSSSLSGGFPWA